MSDTFYPGSTCRHSLLSSDHTDPLADTLVPRRLSSYHPQISSLVKTRGAALYKQDLVTCLFSGVGASLVCSSEQVITKLSGGGMQVSSSSPGTPLPCSYLLRVAVLMLSDCHWLEADIAGTVLISCPHFSIACSQYPQLFWGQSPRVLGVASPF